MGANDVSAKPRQARIGVIGCGWWATEAHLPALQRDPRACIAALADPQAGNLQRAVEVFKPERAFSDAEAMLASAGLDGVIIAVPHIYHSELAMRALESGAHVLIEKPMTLAPGDARAIVTKGRSCGLEVLVSYPWNYNKHALEVRRAIDDERIGQIEAVACMFGSKTRILYEGMATPADGYTYVAPASSTYSSSAIAGGGQGTTQTTHVVGLVSFVLRDRPSEVQSLVDYADLEVDVANAAVFRTTGGAIGTLMSTSAILAAQAPVFHIEIVGRRGDIALDVEAGTAAIRTGDRIERLPELSAEERYPWWRPAENLVDVCLEDGENGSPGEIGLAAVEFIAAMYRSAEERRVVGVAEVQGGPVGE